MCQGLVLRWDEAAPTAVRIYVECLTDKQTHRHTANLTPNILETIYQVSDYVMIAALGFNCDTALLITPDCRIITTGDCTFGII